MLIDVIYSKFFFLVTMTAGVIGYTGMVIYANWTEGVTNKECLAIIKTDPRAMAEYYKGRLIAVAIIVGAAMLTGAIV